MGDFRNYERLRETDIREKGKQAGAICIQDNHNTKDKEIERGNYKIFCAISGDDNATNKGIVGVSVMVTGWGFFNSITNIKRIPSRNISISIKTASRITYTSLIRMRRIWV